MSPKTEPSKKRGVPKAPTVEPGHPTFQRLGKHEPTHEQIAARAYTIYLARGAQPGHELNDWLQAEYELLQLPVDKIAELDTPKSVGPQSRRAGVKKSTLVALVQFALALGTSSLTS